MREDIYSLIIDLLAGDISMENRDLLASWIKESDNNKKEYEQICAIWYATKWARYISHISKNGAWNIIKLKREREIYKRRVYYISSVAASIVILFGAMFTFMDSDFSIPKTIETAALIESRPYSLDNINPLLVLSSGECVDLTKMNSENKLEDGGAKILADSSFISYEAKISFKKGNGGYNEILVPRTKKMKVQLSDGTIVQMNSLSRLRYPVNFKGDTREVYLEGEAYFDVEKDANKPFIVHTSKTDIKVLGTEFNVMSYANEDDTEVTLVNGSVNVKDNDGFHLIKPGEQMSIDNKLLVGKVEQVDVTSVIAWKEGLYCFKSETLEKLLKYLERQYGISYFFQNETKKQMRFSGAFYKNSSIEEIFSMLEQMVDVRFEMQNIKFELQDGQKILIK